MYALGASMGCEDYATWTLFNKLFAQACPLVPQVEDGETFSKFVFISDRDKRLEWSLCEIIPNNLGTSCVHHIKLNVPT